MVLGPKNLGSMVLGPRDLGSRDLGSMVLGSMFWALWLQALGHTAILPHTDKRRPEQ